MDTDNECRRSNAGRCNASGQRHGSWKAGAILYGRRRDWHGDEFHCFDGQLEISFGSGEINFNLMKLLISRDDLAVEPVEQGRGTVGDTLIFDDFLSTTWHVRAVGSSADYSGSYYDVTISDYSGPINGV